MPKIITDCPILIFASLFTTPKAVGIEHPNKGAKLKSKFFGITVNLFSDTIDFSLNVVTLPELTILFFHLYFAGSASIPELSPM